MTDFILSFFPPPVLAFRHAPRSGDSGRSTSSHECNFELLTWTSERRRLIEIAVLYSAEISSLAVLYSSTDSFKYQGRDHHAIRNIATF